MKSGEANAVPFCTVAYSESGGIEDARTSHLILIVVKRPADDRVYVRARPGWRDLVFEKDRAYVLSVLTDISERILHESSVVYRQLSELSVGPLITHRTGPDLSADEELLALYLKFEDIQA